MIAFVCDLVSVLDLVSSVEQSFERWTACELRLALVCEGELVEGMGLEVLDEFVSDITTTTDGEKTYGVASSTYLHAEEGCVPKNEDRFSLIFGIRNVSDFLSACAHTWDA